MSQTEQLLAVLHEISTRLKEQTELSKEQNDRWLRVEALLRKDDPQAPVSENPAKLGEDTPMHNLREIDYLDFCPRLDESEKQEQQIFLQTEDLKKWFESQRLVPSDDHVSYFPMTLRTIFRPGRRAEGRERAEEFLSFLRKLRDSGGGFTIRDGDGEDNNVYFTDGYFLGTSNAFEARDGKFRYYWQVFDDRDRESRSKFRTKVTPACDLNSESQMHIPEAKWQVKESNGSQHKVKDSKWRRIYCISNPWKVFPSKKENSAPEYSPYDVFWYGMNPFGGLGLIHLKHTQYQDSWATGDHAGSMLQLSWYSCLKTNLPSTNNNSEAKNFEVHAGDDRDPGYRNPHPNVFRNGWNVGELGHDGSLIQQETFTMRGDHYSANIDHWSIILLVGNDLRHKIDVNAMLSSYYTQMVSFANTAIDAICGDWTELGDRIDRLILNGELLSELVLKPDSLDQQMFEDGSYSKSRKYFWVIKAVDEFVETLEKTEEKFKKFLQFSEGQDGAAILPIHPFVSKEQQGHATAAVQKLSGLKKRFKLQQERAKDFQNGLFSASQVVESRESSRLGFNIKLLTYITIFYLPLGFCTSLWSTTNTFGFSKLAIVMPIVGIATYLIVFNLDGLVQLGSNVYNYVKMMVLGSMENCGHSSWKSLGKKYRQFQPGRNSTKPSEWWLLVYCLFFIPRKIQSWFKQLVIQRKGRKDPNKASVGAAIA